MSMYPEVSPGQEFQPSAQLSNDVRRLINRGGLEGMRSNAGGKQMENICINAFNPGSSTIPSGTCVEFSDGAMVEGAVPVSLVSGSTVEAWGIATDEIPSSGFGSVLVMGAAVVSVSGGTGSYVVPVNGTTFTRSETGSARILRNVSSDSVLVVVGSVSGSSSGGAVIGFPDYSNPIESGLQLDTFYGPYEDSVWLIGTIKYETVHQTDYYGYDFLEFGSGVRIIIGDTGGFHLTDCHFPFSPGESVLAPYVAYLSSFVNVPIPQGVRFKLVDEFEWGDELELTIYPCL